ncbi:MAG: hypothetical protein QM777_08830 [Pseudorhodoferax sp.]
MSNAQMLRAAAHALQAYNTHEPDSHVLLFHPSSALTHIETMKQHTSSGIRNFLAGTADEWTLVACGSYEQMANLSDRLAPLLIERAKDRNTISQEANP